jgi:predicted ATPase/class 3 adenylate cyclase
MGDLPSGTVTLLFSDMEGSTVLLSRLGGAYADALDGQRRVLRRAWVEHGGTELGTEGDSFLVVFPTAEGAVGAAVQAQRDLAACEWPAGEQVKVRMGIHTGTPQVHDGGYVGMDVHRAARIAGSAHGGQVVVSSATAELVAGCLPDLVVLRDLGRHQLRDIAQVEHLFQLAIEGLPLDFPPLRTLGAASRLPRPATPLVGRDGELAELTALLAPPGARLVTLTGPGGSGKTRLAIGVAQTVAERFLDGAYFVPLAAATTAEVMWTTIGEVLDVPAQERMPPGLFTHVAHRSTLLVLDNLEQVIGCDDVVAHLLDAAPQVVVLATSRRPLYLPGEFQHEVPPLELPSDETLAEAELSGAVQMFVQEARAVKASFALNDTNAGDVVAVCRRLDGLPLALELAAARTKLLSPKALLARLDRALDMAAPGSRAPTRQKTLRDTIAWSYHLLDTTQRAFFRRLGVFADGSSGASLEAVAAVTGDILDGADPLDLVGALNDASLVTITEGASGEPRVGMLVTVRAFALEQLTGHGEADVARTAHAEHYLELARHLQAMWETAYLQAKRVGEAELDNCREALGWTLQPPDGEAPEPARASLGLSLCAALAWLWEDCGYWAEGQAWLELAIERSDGSPTGDLALCLEDLATLLVWEGQAGRARDVASRSLTVARTLGDRDRIAGSLCVLGAAQQFLDDFDAARDSLNEALALHRQAGALALVAEDLMFITFSETRQRHYRLAEDATREGLAISEQLHHELGIGQHGRGLAHVLARMGRVEEAHQHARDFTERILELRDPSLTIEFAATWVDILVRLGQPVKGAQLLGAAEAKRKRNAIPQLWPHELPETLALASSLISAEEWKSCYQMGRGQSVEELLIQLSTA